jgi:hypothetical protein
MPTLLEIQNQCRRAFLAGDTTAITDYLLDEGYSPSLQVAVYRNNASEALRQALLATYPVVAALVGENCFAGVASQYSAKYPSMAPDLQTFGDHMPDFLEALWGTTEFCYLADVARLELACEQVLLEPEGEGRSAELLTGYDANELPQLGLVPVATARLLQSDHPVFSIWRMHQPGHESRDIAMTAGGEDVLVMRRNGDSLIQRLSEPEYLLANSLMQGLSLGNSFEVLVSHSQEKKFQQSLATLLDLQMFSQITFN